MILMNTLKSMWRQSSGEQQQLAMQSQPANPAEVRLWQRQQQFAFQQGQLT
jgi:hypothetical protein